MTNLSKKTTKIPVICSQIILIPIYTVIKFLSLLLDGFLWCGEKVLDLLAFLFSPATKVVKTIKQAVVKNKVIKSKARLERIEESRRKHVEESLKTGDNQNKGLKILITVLKILLLIVLSPVVLFILICMGIYLIFAVIFGGIKRLLGLLTGGKIIIGKEKPENLDKVEKPWRTKFRWKVYSLKQSIGEYFNQYIFIFGKNRKQVSTKQKQDTRFIALMLAFPIAQFLVFWLYVNYRSILLAFQIEIDGAMHWTFANFQRFFLEMKASTNMWTYIRNSLSFFPVSVFITLPLSFISSYFLFKKVPCASFYRIIFYLPSIISGVAFTMLFRYIVSSVGPLSVVEKWLGITPIEFLGTKKWAMPTVLFYTVWTGLGYNMVLLSSSMSRIPTEILESAKIDGAGLAREMFSIVFPLVCGTISTLITLSIAHLFTNIGPVILLTNGQHETNTIASFIYFQVKSASENAYAYGSAIGLVFTIVGLPIVLGGRWLLGRIFESVEL